MIEEFKKETKKILENFKNGLAVLRTNRPTPSLVENILVDYYGSKLKINQLASISIAPPNQILIQPWDKNALQAIEKAVSQSDIKLTPVVEGNLVRLTLPPLTQERRQELLKIAGQRREDARITLRRQREEIKKAIKELEEKGEIREDERFRLQDEVQKIVDEVNREIDELVEKKEREIMEV